MSSGPKGGGIKIGGKAKKNEAKVVTAYANGSLGTMAKAG